MLRKEIPTWLVVVIVVLVLLITGIVYLRVSKSQVSPEVETLPPSHQPALSE